MQRLRKRVKMGLRWLDCGWRLFERNPWLLAGMALLVMVTIIVLSLVPFLGNLLIALATPVIISSAILTVHDLSRQKIALPASLRFRALVRAPKELVRIIQEEKHLLAVSVLCMYTLTLVVLINIVAHLVSAGAWASDLSSLDTAALFTALATRLIVVLLYFSLALSLFYAIPLILLQEEPLIPALGRSIQAGGRHVVALLVIMGLLVAPFLLGTIMSSVSRLTTYVIWLVGGTLVLPVFVTSCYCSYRTVFPTH